MEEKRDWVMCKNDGCNGEDCSDGNGRPTYNGIVLRGGGTPGRRVTAMLSMLAGAYVFDAGLAWFINKKIDLRNSGENNHLRPHVSKRPKQERKYVDFKKLFKKKKKKNKVTKSGR